MVFKRILSEGASMNHYTWIRLDNFKLLQTFIFISGHKLKDTRISHMPEHRESSVPDPKQERMDYCAETDAAIYFLIPPAQLKARPSSVSLVIYDTCKQDRRWWNIRFTWPEKNSVVGNKKPSYILDTYWPSPPGQQELGDAMTLGRNRKGVLSDPKMWQDGTYCSATLFPL